MDDLSLDEIKKEIIKCGKNPAYFLKNYAKITHADRGTIPFKTYDFQDDLLDKFKDHRFNVIVKARQLGISTIVAGYIAWLISFQKDKNVIVMATKYGTASNMVKKVKYIIENMPPFLKLATVRVDNKHSFELTNGSQVKAIATSVDAGRSEAVSLLVVDEAAHIEHMEDIWTGLYPTISTGGRCIALSSPNGLGNWFHKTYEDAELNQNSFVPTSLPWGVHPEHDVEWFEHETKNLPKREIAQEYLCSFNSSGETVIDPDDIDHYRKLVSEPARKSWSDRNLHVWKPYNHQGKYMVVADVARGDGADYSVFHVFNTVNMEQVAEYQGKIEPENFCRLLFDTGKEYGNALMVIETNNIGYTVAQKVIEMGYRNMYYCHKSTHDYVDANQAIGDSSAVPGFITSVKTRPLIINKLDEYIRNKVVKINSLRTVRELEKFIWVSGRPEAQKGYNDDLVMSLAIASWVREMALIVNQKDVDLSRALLMSMGKSNVTLNTSIPGMDDYKSINVSNTKRTYLEYAWLFKG
jgi:hypothetical protein